jgi:hypothetical protein
MICLAFSGDAGQLSEVDRIDPSARPVLLCQSPAKAEFSTIANYARIGAKFVFILGYA